MGTPVGLPNDWQLIAGYLVGPSADLSGVNLTDADLRGAVLTGVRSGGITGTPMALPDGWQLIAGYLVGPGADLSGADLSGANLINTDLDGADLTGADLHGVSSGGITGTPSSLPDGWALISGYLVGPVADLRGASLTGADLSGADLSGAKLTVGKSGGFTVSAIEHSDGWLLVNV